MERPSAIWLLVFHDGCNLLQCKLLVLKFGAHTCGGKETVA